MFAKRDRGNVTLFVCVRTRSLFLPGFLCVFFTFRLYEFGGEASGLNDHCVL